MTKHTKGPWDAPMFEHPIGKFSITGGKTVFGKPFVIAWVNDPETATAGEAMANCHLIKAAPNLLEAAEVVLVAWQRLAAALPYDDRIEAIEFNEFAKLRSAVAEAVSIQPWDIHKHLFGSLEEQSLAESIGLGVGGRGVAEY